MISFNLQKRASVVELVDTLDLGSSALRCESSSLSARICPLLDFIDEEVHFLYHFVEVGVVADVNERFFGESDVLFSPAA